MIKFYFSLIVLAATITFANAQCTINLAAQTTPGINPEKENLPCIEIGKLYDETVQVKIQETGDTTIVVSGFSVPIDIRVDSVRVDSVTGLPAGIIWTKNPDVMKGGANGCANFYGTTSDNVGTYNLTAWGTVWFRINANPPIIGPIDTPYVYTGSLNRFSPFGEYYLRVINSGAPCVVPSSIKDFSSALNASLTVYPNPSNGNFVLNLNAARRISGVISIVDMTGKQVFTQAIDAEGFYTKALDVSNLAKGLYSIQIRTAEGNVARSILIE